MKTTLPNGSSEEYQAMYESMTYRISGNDEGYSSCKVYTYTKIMI